MRPDPQVRWHMYLKRAAMVAPKLPDRIVNGISELNRSKLQIDSAHAAILKQIPNQNVHSGRCSDDFVQVLPPLLIQVLGTVLLQRFSKSHDCAQRSAQVMRDRVDRKSTRL